MNVEALRKKQWYAIGLLSLVSILLLGFAASSYGESFGQAIAVGLFFMLPFPILAVFALTNTVSGWFCSLAMPSVIFFANIFGGLTVEYNPFLMVLWLFSIAALYYFSSSIRLRLLNAAKLSDNTIRAVNAIKSSLSKNIMYKDKKN